MDVAVRRRGVRVWLSMALLLALAAFAGSQQLRSAPADDAVDDPRPLDQPTVDAEVLSADPRAKVQVNEPDEVADPLETAMDDREEAVGPRQAGQIDDEESEDDSEEGRKFSFTPASLNGVCPGATTLKELHEQWGEPVSTQTKFGKIHETFEIKRLGTVRATIDEGVVCSLVWKLPSPVPADAIGKQLRLDDLEPVDIFDDFGQPLGRAYPERGVLVGFLPKSNPPRAFQVVVEPIDAQSFLARAEVRLQDRYEGCVEDLRVVNELAPESARAFWIYAELARRAGELSGALEAAERAVEMEPEASEYRLTLIRALAASGKYSQAIGGLRELIEGKTASEIVTARAYVLWGDCIARGPQPDYAQALKLHTKAISLAQPLVKSTKQSLRRAAKEVLLDAHLAIAHDIGWGRWQQQADAVSKWLDKAAAYAEDLVTREHASDELRLRVYERAIAAIAGIAEPPDANKWIRNLTEQGAKLLEEVTDSTYRSHLAWRMGESLAAAVEIESARNHADKALKLGTLAQNYLEQGEAVSHELPARDYVRGRLCYRLGAIQAIEREDHRRAIEWFDHAVPLLESPMPESALSDAGRQGEKFVSMAVSYWETNQREEAVRLTEQGVALMEQAADEGILEKTALSIPYGNLASMHAQLGHAKVAREYAARAASWEAPAKK